MTAVIGDGASEALRGPGAGRVVGTFNQGFYVRSAAGLAAVGGPGVAAGPLHLTLPYEPPRTAEGEPVTLDGERLVGAGWNIDLRAARPFRPSLPTREALAALGGVLDEVLEVVLVGDRWPLDAATRAELAALDLDAARVLLQGRGAGLTPAGDDVLAGLLLVHRWWWPGSDEARAVAAAADTTELSRALLRWAAVGQSVQPVHELAAAAGRDHAAAVAAAAWWPASAARRVRRCSRACRWPRGATGTYRIG